MHAYPCGHDAVFSEFEPTCAVYVCERPVRFWVTYTGPGIGGYPTFRIAGSCRWHRRKVLAFGSADPANNDDVRIRSVSLAALESEYHASGLCHDHAISVTTTGRTDQERISSQPQLGRICREDGGSGAERALILRGLRPEVMLM